jgi:hypothetical protein
LCKTIQLTGISMFVIIIISVGTVSPITRVLIYSCLQIVLDEGVSKLPSRDRGGQVWGPEWRHGKNKARMC